MNRSAWANRKATAGPECEICFFLGGTGRNLETLIGNSADEKLFFVLVESEGLVGHDSDPFLHTVYGWGDFVGSSGYPEPFQSFRSRFSSAEWKKIVSWKHQLT